ncbi:MAG TPA: sigma-54 dependent transcriptional regulator [Candidatus Sulfotelmatobacter sp.]|nr:sigma-54 dependent transcriptional regulator [Candidatus Sulfotelmatobacter sp.]HWI57222.1 sigma-54 dependent transcriptional regulator [Bacillota bacterium]
MMQATILLIEDDPSTGAALQKLLQAEGYAVALCGRGDEGFKLAQGQSWDLVITDLKLPGLSGLELVRQLRGVRPRLPIILMTAHGTTETAIEAMKLGAFEYLLKPFEADALLDLVGKAVASSRLMSEEVELGQARSSAPALVGQSRAMQSLYKEIGRIAAAPVTVLIRGATGTGKELIARAIYQHSDRADKPFIAVNCAAIPETLLESELFGHERGSFTGAQARRIGRFEQAQGGTLFLDEIGDMAANTQAKLLRVLQEKSIQRVGGDEVLAVDVRVLAATHRDLEAAIQEREFREDLFYRLSVVTITLPSLRERPEDIPELVRYFIGRYAKELGVHNPSIASEALGWLQIQSWPGNVRELENVVRQALLLARPFAIGLEHVQQAAARTRKPMAAANQSYAAYIAELLARVQRGEQEGAHARMIADLESELFAQAIQLAQGNQAKVARWLGVTRLKVREKLTELGLHPTRETPAKAATEPR